MPPCYALADPLQTRKRPIPRERDAIAPGGPAGAGRGPRRIVGVYSQGPRLPELLERLGLGERPSRLPLPPAG